MNDALKLIEGATGKSLETLQEEINFFLDEKDESKQEKKEQKPKGKEESNPFVALFGGYEKKPFVKEEKQQPKGKTQIKPETYSEKEYLRHLAGESAKNTTFTIFDLYKKVHGMASYT